MRSRSEFKNDKGNKVQSGRIRHYLHKLYSILLDSLFFGTFINIFGLFRLISHLRTSR